MFYLLVIILKPRVHLKYHVSIMGILLHDYSYLFNALSKKKKYVLKDSLSSIIKIMLCWLRTLKQIIVFPKFKQPANFFFSFIQVLETPLQNSWPTLYWQDAYLLLKCLILVLNLINVIICLVNFMIRKEISLFFHKNVFL